MNTRILKNDQIQTSGYELINQIKNIVVTFLAATFVVHGKMTLGELLSVSYIVGQMNALLTKSQIAPTENSWRYFYIFYNKSGYYILYLLR